MAIYCPHRKTKNVQMKYRTHIWKTAESWGSNENYKAKILYRGKEKFKNSKKLTDFYSWFLLLRYFPIFSMDKKLSFQYQNCRKRLLKERVKLDNLPALQMAGRGLEDLYGMITFLLKKHTDYRRLTGHKSRNVSIWNLWKQRFPEVFWNKI